MLHIQLISTASRFLRILPPVNPNHPASLVMTPCHGKQKPKSINVLTPAQPFPRVFLPFPRISARIAFTGIITITIMLITLYTPARLGLSFVLSSTLSHFPFPPSSQWGENKWQTFQRSGFEFNSLTNHKVKFMSATCVGQGNSVWPTGKHFPTRLATFSFSHLSNYLYLDVYLSIYSEVSIAVTKGWP